MIELHIQAFSLFTLAGRARTSRTCRTYWTSRCNGMYLFMHKEHLSADYKHPFILHCSFVGDFSIFFVIVLLSSLVRRYLEWNISIHALISPPCKDGCHDAILSLPLYQVNETLNRDIDSSKQLLQGNKLSRQVIKKQAMVIAL